MNGSGIEGQNTFQDEASPREGVEPDPDCLLCALQDAYVRAGVDGLDWLDDDRDVLRMELERGSLTIHIHASELLPGPALVCTGFLPQRFHIETLGNLAPLLNHLNGRMMLGKVYVVPDDEDEDGVMFRLLFERAALVGHGDVMRLLREFQYAVGEYDHCAESIDADFPGLIEGVALPLLLSRAPDGSALA